jgi:predicted Zn finger-like uncharacterized protein
MDVRCERCQTEYEVEDAKVSDLGTEVQCSDCGHRFVAKRPSGSGEDKGASSDEWLLETVAGQSHKFENSFLLQKWIVERRVTREDRISRNGQPWQRLAEVAEVAPFFNIVDDAVRADAAAVTPAPVVPSSTPALIAPTLPEVASPPPQMPLRMPSPVASRPEGENRSARPAPLSPLPLPGDSLGGVHLGAFPQASDPGETEIIRVGSRRSHGFLKLVLTMLVAAVVAYAGIVWQHQRPRSAMISSSGMAEDESLRNHAQATASAPAPRAPAEAIEPEQASGQDDGVAPRGPLVEPMAESGRDERAARGGKRAVATRKPKAEASHAIRPNSPSSRAQPGAPEALAAQGYAALTHRQYSQAIVLFKRALVGSPSNGTALFGLAEAHRASGQKMAALLTYRRYVEAFPAGPNAIAARTQVRLLEGKKR